MTGRLAGRKALVTGAASGIGREIARLFAAEGASVAALDISEAGLGTLSDVATAGIRCDVSDPDSVNEAVAKAASALGGLDTVVNAAGILLHVPFADIEPDQFRKLFAVNLLGTSMICRAATQHLLQAEGSSIVNIASQAAVKPTAGTSAYAATKAGVLMLTKCLALELAPIRVNAICPGMVDTPMTEAIMANNQMVEHIIAGNALHSVALPPDIAAGALYLASAEARFVTGTQILIDGGSAFT